MARNKKGKEPTSDAQVTRQLSQVKGEAARQVPLSEDRIVVPLIEEELQVQKEWVEAGQVLIKKHVETRTETVPVELGYEEVHVDRVPVNRALGPGESPSPRQEGDTLIIPVVEEELIVTKLMVVREEIRVTKRRATRQEQVSDQVRSERISVENAGDIGFVGE